MFREEVENSIVFAEFDPQGQEYWFDFCKEKVVPHIDTFYYTVSIEDDSNDNVKVGNLLNRLNSLKDRKLSCRQNDVEYLGLSYSLTHFSHYDFCLSYNENYDIFISSILPNAQTPRIVVQLRTRSLVLEGVVKSIDSSFDRVKAILRVFELSPRLVRENRIDYAFHSNQIQNPYKYFSDEFIVEHLKSKLRLYHKVGNIRGKEIEIDYFSLGNRKSNNVFVRIYNKTQEVIEKNYKSFFISRWREHGLINAYDEFVYEVAYRYGTYRTGVLLGRIEWYLEYGGNDEIKNILLQTKNSCYGNSDNIEQLAKIVNQYLPPVTLIMNIEFQTKRKFYTDCDEFIQSHLKELSDNVENAEDFIKHSHLDNALVHSDNVLHRLYTIYNLRSEFCHYLTNETVCFVDNKGKKTEKPRYFWKRIIDCQIDEYNRKVLDVWRVREQHTNIKRAENRFFNDVAHLKFLIQNSTNDETSFEDDLSDALCSLNDNDFYGKFVNAETGETFNLSSKNKSKYETLKKRKSRQMRGIIKN